MSMRWYAIHTTPGYENKVHERILKKIEERQSQSLFGEIKIPSEEVIELRNGKKTKLTRRLMPGYIFIQMSLSDNEWHMIRKIPNVLGFIGGDKPTQVKQSEIDELSKRETDSKNRPAPKVMFSIDETLRIKTGAFADFNGRVSSIDYDKARLRIMVQVFGRDTPVDIGFDDVEKI